MSTQDEVKNLIWLIDHYKRQADECFTIYSRLQDIYLMYDHNMVYVSKYQNRLDAIFEY